MKVYLLNPPFVKGYCRDACWQASGRAGTFRYPIWLAYATAQLSLVHEVKLVDAVAKKMTQHVINDDISNYEPDVIVVNTNWASLKNDRKFAEELKKSHVDSKVLEFGIPSGVSDYELYVMLTGKERLKPDEIPFVSKIYKEFLDVKDYYLAECFYPVVQIWAHGVTCPFHCTFCNRIHRTNRFTSPERAVDEVEWIKDNLPEVKEVHYEDDTFTLDENWIRRYCQEIENRKLDFVWSCQVRADVSLEMLKKMKNSGCRLVICGFESGNDKILRNIKKGITVQQSIKFAENVRKAGILLQADVIIGLPEETKETIEQTRKMINKIQPDILQVTVATPYPNTEFYDWIKEHNYFVSNNYLDERGLQSCMIAYPELSAKEIQDAVNEMLNGYYKSWKFVRRAFSQVFRRNGWEELKRLWRSAKMFKL